MTCDNASGLDFFYAGKFIYQIGHDDYMPLVNSRKILIDAMNTGFALGHFNVENLETVDSVVQAAEARKSPVMLAVTESAISYAGLNNIVNLIKTAAKYATVPVVLHLDHGRNMSAIKDCVLAGFTSIMIDASAYPLNKNIRLTKEVVKLCKKRRISVEAEIGSLVKMSSEGIALTDPIQAREFANKTGIDSLAIAIGTSHGAYKFKDKQKLDFVRLKKINELVDIPLVLHGASKIPADVVRKGIKYGAKWHGARGVDDQSLKKARTLGIDKVNIHTDLNLIRIAAYREYLKKNVKETDPRRVHNYTREKVIQYVKNRMDVLGSSKQA